MRAYLQVLSSAAGFARERCRKFWGGTPRSSRLPSWNGLFRKDRLVYLKHEKQELETFDLYLYGTLNNPRLLGQIVFEYGTLLNAFDRWENAKILDVGTGRSTLPDWMSFKGADAVEFEHPDQVEAKISGKFAMLNRCAAKKGRRKPTRIFGDMRKLPFSDSTFDLVTCFSVLEHLDTDMPSRRYVPYDEQRRRVAKALEEMVRVTKHGGAIYITSECCDFEKARTDAWRQSYYFKDGPAISSAWPVGDVRRLFYDDLKRMHCDTVGPNEFDPAELDRGENFWTFRGPYFSAFSVLVKKDDAGSGK